MYFGACVKQWMRDERMDARCLVDKTRWYYRARFDMFA